jgi:hypothetical protein
MVSLVSIYVGGILTILIALFHTRFYRMFNWEGDFKKIALLNQRVLYTVHLALLFLFFMLGSLSIIYARELSQGFGLAFGFNLASALFWVWRLVWQFVYFKKRSKQKSSTISVVLIAVFMVLIVCYLIPVWYRLGG